MNFSSGDEIDEDFNQGANDGSDSDSFEKEMEMELNKEFSHYSQHLFDTQTTGIRKLTGGARICSGG
jgi:nucleoside-specific outer membrane channel protein Tsx